MVQGKSILREFLEALALVPVLTLSAARGDVVRAADASSSTALSPLPAVSTSAAAAPAVFSASASSAPAPSPVSALESSPFRLLSENELPDFADSLATKSGLVKAVKKSIDFLENRPQPKYFRFGGRRYSPTALVDSLKAFLKILRTAQSSKDISDAIRSGFDVYQSAGSDGAGKVVFSGYYEPLLKASAKNSPGYRHPIYRRPPDMVEADLGEFDKKWAGETLIGRVGKNKRFVPYFTRGDIDIRKVLSGRRLEIAWLKDAFDVMDLHIQGSGILAFPSGRKYLAQYAGTNSLPYNAVGLLLIKTGIFSRDDISRDKVKDYLRAHPESEAWILAQNPRYTFFKLMRLPKDGQPFGTAEESLTPARSIAVDADLIPLGALAFFTTSSPQADEKGRLLGNFPSSQFALCLDTGGAIKGPGRVDIYEGWGPQAATIARSQWSPGELYILIKKVVPRDG